jgi:hypothetical protein
LDPLRHFTWNVAIASVLILALIAFTPLADFYLQEIAGVSAGLTGFIVPGLHAALLLPGLTALQSWLRALLMKGDATATIYKAMALNLIVTGLVLVAGVLLDTPGIQMAALALTVAMLGELGFLGWRVRDLVPKMLAAA